MQASIENSKDVFAERFSDRLKWMQTPAARLTTSRRMPAPEAIRAIADLCIAEANGDEAVFGTQPQGLFGATTGTEAFKLRKPGKVVGVNAIRENACLDFGPVNLSVVLEMNG